MLARRKAKLPFYLNALREKEYAEKYPGCLLNNFHNLLRFWQRHYLNKDKDSTCLENVSSSHSFLYTTDTPVNISLNSTAAARCVHLLSGSTVYVQSLCCHENIPTEKSHAAVLWRWNTNLYNLFRPQYWLKCTSNQHCTITDIGNATTRRYSPLQNCI